MNLWHQIDKMITAEDEEGNAVEITSDHQVMLEMIQAEYQRKWLAGHRDNFNKLKMLLKRAEGH